MSPPPSAGSSPSSPPSGRAGSRRLDAAALRAAFVLFDRGAYFEAHEALEPLWLAASGEDREALHGLLQVAVGFHHAANGNAHGAGALLDRALSRLARCPIEWRGVDLAALRGAVTEIRAAIAAGRLAERVAAGLPWMPPAIP